MQQPVIHTDREYARDYLARKVASQQAALLDPASFSTFSPRTLIEDAEWRLRWIDCAPDSGVNFILAPLQDKRGVPCGGAWSENVGACKEVREARVRLGRDPIIPLGLRGES